VLPIGSLLPIGACYPLVSPTVFKQKFCILQKSKVPDGTFNQKRAYKSDRIILSECISSLIFQCTTMIHDRTEREHIRTESFRYNSRIWLQNHQKTLMLTSKKYCFLVILKPNPRILPKTLRSNVLTFCPIN
jgi:hypothetical protein